MPPVYTPEPELGSPCPPFRLPATDGRTYGLEDYQGRPLVVMFICNHCPYVKAVEDRILNLGREYGKQGIAFVAICANDAERYPEDAFDKLKERAEEKNYPFPYLHDESQEVAKSFGAVCTPDFFVYDSDHRLAYRGRLDDSWKDPSQVTRQELREALECLIEKRPVPTDQKPSMGCSIKWIENP